MLRPLRIVSSRESINLSSNSERPAQTFDVCVYAFSETNILQKMFVISEMRADDTE
jgi:hypothetical protein